MDAEALYGLPLEEFTRQRDALARVLREAGEREQAAAVVALRKPTLVAWAVNQLARAHAREVDLLLDASHRLIEAQTGASPSESASVAATRQRDALAALVRRGRELLGPRATATTIARVADTLRAASLTPDGRERLARGTLDREIASTGWELLDTGAAAAPVRPPRGGARPARESAGKDTANDAARRAAAAEAAAAAAAERKARLTAAREAVQQARRAVDEARERLGAAEKETASHRRALEAALRAGEEAAGGLDGARERLAMAEAELDRVRKG